MCNHQRFAVHFYNEMTSNLYLRLWLSLSLPVLCFSDPVALRLSIGTVIGRIVDINGSQAEVFTSIPFALPPVKSLRYEFPLPLNKSEDSIDTNREVECVSFAQRNSSGSEDCLYMKVVVPLDQNGDRFKKSLPVLFWIHGGSFLDKAGDTFEETEFISELSSEPVIVVAPNYRLGPLGFLTVLHDDFPGNYGLEDVLMSLNVFFANTASFNADPRRVFIGGHGAGAAIASILATSPRTQGRLAGVILSGGSSLSRWAVRSHATEANSAHIIHSCNCSRPSVDEMKSCMKSVDIPCLSVTHNHLQNNIYKSPLESLRMRHTVLTPVVDVFRINESIIPLRIEKIVENEARIPLLLLSSHFEVESRQDGKGESGDLNEQLNSFVSSNSKSRKYIISSLGDAYFPGLHSSSATFIRMIEDELHSFMYEEALLYSAKQNEVYIFEEQNTDMDQLSDWNLSATKGLIYQFITTGEISNLTLFSLSRRVANRLKDGKMEEFDWFTDRFHYWRRSLPLLESLNIHPEVPIQIENCKKEQGSRNFQWKTVFILTALIVGCIIVFLYTLLLKRRKHHRVVQISPN